MCLFNTNSTCVCSLWMPWVTIYNAQSHENYRKTIQSVCPQTFDWLCKKRKKKKANAAAAYRFHPPLLPSPPRLLLQVPQIRPGERSNKNRGQRWRLKDTKDGENNDTHRQRDKGQTERWPANIEGFTPRHTSRLTFSEGWCWLQPSRCLGSFSSPQQLICPTFPLSRCRCIQTAGPDAS